MTNAVWEASWEMILLNEGGYVNDCHDTGGETCYGISKKAYPNVDIKNLTKEQAKKIYWEDYWKRCKCGFMPDCLSIMVFDYAVNSGCKKAITSLQEALGVKADGIIGNQTIGACNRVPLKPVIETYTNKRLAYLIKLKNFKYYGKGWTDRVFRVKKQAEMYL